MMDVYTKMDKGKFRFLGGYGQDGDGQRLAESTLMGRAKNVCAMNMWLHVVGAEVKATANFIGGMESSNIWVNDKAQRFIHEDIVNSFDGLMHTNNVVHNENRAYSIFDTAHIKFWEENGTTSEWSGFCPVGTPITAIPEALDEAVSNPEIAYFRADTIESLAMQIDLDPTALKATIDAWNVDVEKGADSHFGKNPETMFMVAEPPFYAAQLRNGVLTTVGGIRVNENAQVCAPDGTIVEGLYAAGVAASGFSSETYGGAPGAAQGCGLFLGRLAGRAAANKQ
jgi:fumarate reductase flavoprotein subunit